MTQINNMEDLNELPILGEEHIADVGKTITITDEDDNVYEFEKPEFECELLKVVNNRIIGYYKNNRTSYTNGATWYFDGKCWLDDGNYSEFNLTPIQKKWYEDEANYGKRVFLVGDTYKASYIKTIGQINGGTLALIKSGNLKLAKKQERDSLYCEE